MAGFPTALNGQIVHSLNYQPAVEATRFDAGMDVPLNFKAGFLGAIGIAEGIAPVMIRLGFATPAQKSQFNFLAMMASQRGTVGFSYDFWEGNPGLGYHWLVIGCKIGNWQLTNDPAQGQTDRSISIMGMSYQLI